MQCSDWTTGCHQKQKGQSASLVIGLELAESEVAKKVAQRERKPLLMPHKRACID